MFADFDDACALACGAADGTTAPAVRRRRRASRLPQLERTRPGRGLQRLARHRLERALAVELEALELQRALLRESRTLRFQLARPHVRRKRSALTFERPLSLTLFKLELLSLQALTQGKLIEPARVGRIESVTSRSCALPQLKVERILLLLDVQPAVLEDRVRRDSQRLRGARRCENEYPERPLHERSDYLAA